MIGRFLALVLIAAIPIGAFGCRTGLPAESQEPLGPAVYTSRHGFSIEYPHGWVLQSSIENFPTIQQARHGSGNHFEIYSYDPLSQPGISDGSIPQEELKIAAHIYDNLGQTLDQWISSVANPTEGQGMTIERTEDLTINNRPARKVWGVVGETHTLSAYYVDGERSALIQSHPHDSSRESDFDRILRSFKFTDQSGITSYGPPRPGVVAEVYGTGSCLNVRVSPSTAAGRRFCITDGTMVQVDSGPVEADNYRWWRLRTFDGWAVEDYLKYDPD
jgi:hypothetical protein